jgi:glycosyltransferase involved in cell wall biosynthesis
MRRDLIRVLELRSVRGTGGGPEKTILNGAARADRGRFEVTVCYLRDARDTVFGIDRRAGALPIAYTEIRERHSFDRAIWPELVRIVRERHIDIVHAHEYKTDLLALALARATGVLPLATVHGWTGHSARERRVYYPFDKWLLRRYPRVIAVSTEIASVLARAGVEPERITTLLNGIDPEMFRLDRGAASPLRRDLRIGARELVIGTVGRAEPQKRYDVLVDAFARLRERRRNARLIVAGDGSELPRLKARADALQLGASCLFLGHRADIHALHHAFDLFVQSSDYEGTPNAVLEAMALETPIVTTAAGGTTDLVRDAEHALVVPCGDPIALDDAIERTLADPAAAAARVAAARARTEGELSFERRTRALEAIYAQLVADHRAARAA